MSDFDLKEKCFEQDIEVYLTALTLKGKLKLRVNRKKIRRHLP